MYEQLTLFQLPAPPARTVYGSGIGQVPALPGRKDSAHMESIYLNRLLPLEEYDMIIVLFSGGKDSLACVLDLLERGVPREKMELWHHDIDGGHPTRKMDWPVTQNYVRAVAEYLGISVLVDWDALGFTIVSTAANGRQALAFLKKHPVDLVIADIQMPVMGGLELMEILRRDKISDAHFVILSGYSDFEYARQALRFDCMDYLLKPIMTDQLTQLLQKVQASCRRSNEGKRRDEIYSSAYLAQNLLRGISGPLSPGLAGGTRRRGNHGGMTRCWKN